MESGEVFSPISTSQDNEWARKPQINETPKVANTEVGNNYESEISVKEIQYHGVNIKIIEAEHGRSMGGQELPVNWKQQVENNMGNPNVVFLEYFMPDLQSGINREPFSAHFIGKWAKDYGVVEFSQAAAVMAGKRGCDISVADTAGDGFYFLQDIISMSKWKKETQKFPEMEYRSYDGHNTMPDTFDFEIATAVDSRRLMTARALMGEALLMQSKNTENPNIVCITPKAHAERVVAYIQRQNDAELLPGVKVEKPEDLIKFGQKVDMEKAERYKRSIGLKTIVRRFSPQEPGYTYEVGGLVIDRQYDKALEILNRQEQTIKIKVIKSLIEKIKPSMDSEKSNTEKILSKILDPNNSWIRTGYKRIP